MLAIAECEIVDTLVRPVAGWMATHRVFISL